MESRRQLEPRTNTSRRALFQDDYVDALLAADRTAIAEVGDEPIYSITGEVTECLSAEAVAESAPAAPTDAAPADNVHTIHPAAPPSYLAKHFYFLNDQIAA